MPNVRFINETGRSAQEQRNSAFMSGFNQTFTASLQKKLQGDAKQAAEQKQKEQADKMRDGLKRMTAEETTNKQLEGISLESVGGAFASDMGQFGQYEDSNLANAEDIEKARIAIGNIKSQTKALDSAIDEMPDDIVQNIYYNKIAEDFLAINESKAKPEKPKQATSIDMNKQISAYDNIINDEEANSVVSQQAQNEKDQYLIDNGIATPESIQAERQTALEENVSGVTNKYFKEDGSVRRGQIRQSQDEGFLNNVASAEDEAVFKNNVVADLMKNANLSEVEANKFADEYITRAKGLEEGKHFRIFSQKTGAEDAKTTQDGKGTVKRTSDIPTSSAPTPAFSAWNVNTNSGFSRSKQESAKKIPTLSEEVGKQNPSSKKWNPSQKRQEAIEKYKQNTVEKVDSEAKKNKLTPEQTNRAQAFALAMKQDVDKQMLDKNTEGLTREQLEQAYIDNAIETSDNSIELKEILTLFGLFNKKK